MSHARTVHGYRYIRIGETRWRCQACRAAVCTGDLAQHALEQHPARPLAGQLAIECTGVAEVAR